MAEHHAMQGSLNFQASIQNLTSQAERALKAAQQLATASDPSAEAAFEDAERLADRAADPELQVQAYERFGMFLKQQRKFGRARQRFVKAERTAQFLDLDETTARLQVHIAETDIELVADTRGKVFFANFRKGAQGGSYSWQDRRDVWFSFIDDLNAAGGRLAARKFGSEDDFRGRLDAARRGAR